MRFFSHILLAGIAGCGGSTISVSGELSLAGKPIDTGNVRFFPVMETEEKGAVGPISNGRCEIAEKQGLVAGKDMVQVSGMQKAGRMIRPK